MKLNPECIKDTMICLEEVLSLDEKGYFNGGKISEITRNARLQDYPTSEILYAILQLDENKYIVSDMKIEKLKYMIHISTVFYITPKGYDFLSAAKKSEAWGLVKKATEPLKNFSFKIAETVLFSYLENHL